MYVLASRFASVIGHGLGGLLMLANFSLPFMRSNLAVPEGLETSKVTAAPFEGEAGFAAIICVSPVIVVPTVKFAEAVLLFAFASGSDISFAVTVIV